MRLRFEERASCLFSDRTIYAYDDRKAGVYVGKISYDHMYGESHIGEIYGFNVEPDYRGKGGAARPLLQQAETGLMQLGFKRAGLTVSQTNQHARAFYERNGWRRVRRPSRNSTALLYYGKTFGR